MAKISSRFFARLVLDFEDENATFCLSFRLEKMSFITGEECIESNVITVEALKFLEDEVRFDEFSSKEQNDDEEDLVC